MVKRLEIEVGLIAQTNEHSIAVDLDLVARGILRGGHADDATGSHIELGTVPWAYDTKVFEFTVAEGSAVVSAQVLDAKDLLIVSDQDHKAVKDVHGFGLPLR